MCHGQHQERAGDAARCPTACPATEFTAGINVRSPPFAPSSSSPRCCCPRWAAPGWGNALIALSWLCQGSLASSQLLSPFPGITSLPPALKRRRTRPRCPPQGSGGSWILPTAPDAFGGSRMSMKRVKQLLALVSLPVKSCRPTSPSASLGMMGQSPGQRVLSLSTGHPSPAPQQCQRQTPHLGCPSPPMVVVVGCSPGV